ncbi:MAG: PEGA domain-containing protein [Candidatus Baldrarchaeota archaeon]
MGLWSKIKSAFKKVGSSIKKATRKLIRHWTGKAKKSKATRTQTAKQLARSIRNRTTKWKKEVEKHNKILRGTKTAKNIHNPKRRKKELAKRTKTAKQYLKDLRKRLKQEKDHSKKIDKAIKHDKNIKNKAEQILKTPVMKEWKEESAPAWKQLYYLVQEYLSGAYDWHSFINRLSENRHIRVLFGDTWPKNSWEWITFAASMVGPAVMKAGMPTKMTSLTKMSMSKAAFLQLLDKIKKNPVGMAKEFMKFTPVVRNSIMEALSKDYHGKLALKELLEAVWELEYKKGTPLMKRFILFLGKKHAWLWGLIAAVLGFGAWGPWIPKEWIKEQFGINYQDIVRKGEWDLAAKYYPAYKKFTETANAGVSKISWLNPFTKKLWDEGIEAAKADLEMTKERIEKHTKETAQFTISSNPPGATIYVDGRSGYGTTPTKWPIKITPGAHKITLEKPGFKPYYLEVSLAPGAEHDFGTVPLEPGEEPKGLVYIETDPPKARIFLGDTYLGRSNDKPIELAKGRYDLTLIKEGYSEKTITVLIKEPGETVTEFVVLKPKENKEEEIRYYAGKGTVTIIPDPADAFITIPDEIYSWLGEITLSLNPGKYSVQARRDGYKTETKTFTVKAGDDKTIRIKLEPLPEEKPPEKELYRVDVESDPPGAKILINDAFTNKWTPDYVILESGEYELKLVKSGYEPWTTPLIL